MFTGIGIYNCSLITPIMAYELGVRIFELIGAEANSVGYYKHLENGDHAGDHDVVDTTLEELEVLLRDKAATAFRIALEDSHSPWSSSFGYMTEDFGLFSHIDIQCPFVPESHIAEEVFRIAAEFAHFPYGIAYTADNVVDAFDYVTGNNLVKLFPYEAPDAWSEEVLPMYGGAQRYKDSMLRLVYPYNVINKNHLALEIELVRLGDWIRADSDRGHLIELTNDLWLWEVEPEKLEEINNALGAENLLLCWRPEKKKKKNFIP